MNSLPLPKLVSFPLCCRHFSDLPILSCHPHCLQSDVCSGSSEYFFAKGSVCLSQGFIICGSTSSQLFINCCCIRGQILLLPILDEPFFPISFSVGRWIVLRMGRWSDDRVSNGSQSYLSRKAAWRIVASGEKK